jgi:polyisoprenyl-phosphate glycosyltransferase
MSTPQTNPTSNSSDQVLILMPVFNDWVCLAALLAILDRELAVEGIAARVLVVDDGSTSPAADLPTAQYRALRRIEVLELRRNLGHQRAIAVGLAYLDDHDPCETVVVMDSDGEDDPKDVPRLLRTYRDQGCQKIVFAERSRRSEPPVFRAFYTLYKMGYRVLTGRVVRFGNFSVIPRRRLASLVTVSELWNHYVGAVLKSRQPICMVTTQRAKRLHGQSTMNFVGLVLHGLSAISVDSDLVGIRLLMVSLLLIAMVIPALIAIVALKFWTNLAIPGWATMAFGLTIVLLFQIVSLAVMFSFIVLGGRQGSSFLPRRDYSHYVSRIYLLG